MAGKDKIDTQPEFSFVESDPFANSTIDLAHWKTKEIYRKELLVRSSPIKEKWLYAFRSVGREYAVNPNNGDFERRMGKTGSAGQLLTSPGLKQTIKRTSQPKEHAEQPVLEVWFDKDGYAHSLDIEKNNLWKKARHDRPHPDPRSKNPKAKVAARSTVRLALTDDGTKNGKPLRWYFLLSEVRLGPKALAKCTEKGMGDGLSIHPCADLAPAFENLHKAKFLSPVELKIWRQRNPNPGQNTALKIGLTIGVVDPYNMARKINSDILQHAMDMNLKLSKRLKDGEQVPGFVHRRFTNNKKNGGSIHDLYAIAQMTKAWEARHIKDRDRWVAAKKQGHWSTRTQQKTNQWDPYLRAQFGEFPDWDRKSAGDVIKFVNTTLKDVLRGLEARAAMLVNWLESPAHQIIDTAIAHDTLGASSDRDIEQAGEDRAYAIGHWYSVTSFLQMTKLGSSFLAALPDLCPNNAIDQCIRPYATKPLVPARSANSPGALPPDRRVDWHALAKASRFIPDLVLRQVMLDAREKQRSVADKAKEVAALVNNIGFFDELLATTPPANLNKQNKNAYQLMQPYIDKGITIWATGADAPGALLKTYKSQNQSLLFKSHVDKLFAEADANSPSFGSGSIAHASGARVRASTSTRPRRSPPLQRCSLSPRRRPRISARHQSSRGSRRSSICRSMSPGPLKPLLCSKATSPKPCRCMSMRSRGRGAIKVGTARVGVALSVLGMIGAAWTVWTNIRTVADAIQKGDMSVVVGASLASVGGLAMFTIGVAEFTKWGVLSVFTGGIGAWIAGFAILIGSLIAMFTEDEDDRRKLLLEHFFFAKNPASRNSSALWDGKSSHPWFGSKPSGSWSVKRQRQALINMMARYTVQGHATAPSSTLATSALIRDVAVTIEWTFLPEEVEFDVELMNRRIDLGTLKDKYLKPVRNESKMEFYKRRRADGLLGHYVIRCTPGGDHVVTSKYGKNVDIEHVRKGNTLRIELKKPLELAIVSNTVISVSMKHSGGELKHTLPFIAPGYDIDGQESFPASDFKSSQ